MLTYSQRTGVDACVRYLVKQAGVPALRRGAGLGLADSRTGVAEGACRHLIGDRFGITGSRWSVDGAEAVLRLRALEDNGDFDAYWAFHLARSIIASIKPPPGRYGLTA